MKNEKCKKKQMLLFLHLQLATGGKGLRPHARLKAAMLPTPLPGSKCSNAQMFKMFKCSKFSNVHNVQNAIKFSHMFKIGNTFLQENYIKNKRTYIMILPIAYHIILHITGAVQQHHQRQHAVLRAS